MHQPTFFVDTILPLAVPKLYTYRVPKELNEKVLEGQRVIVQFGKNKYYTAVIRHIHTMAPADYTAKYLEDILDETPLINQHQLMLWEWISMYYLCTIGEVMNAALPSGLKLSSEAQLCFQSDFNGDVSGLTDKELLIIEALENRHLVPVKDLVNILQQKTIYPILKSLIDKGIIWVEEEIRERYKPKMIDYVQLTEEANVEDKLKKIFDTCNRAPKQLELLMAFVHLSQRYSKKQVAVKKADLLEKANATTTCLNQLVKKNVFEIHQLQEERIPKIDLVEKLNKQLNDDQQKALESVKSSFAEKDVVLLHGVTSSGKTAIYVKLIEETLAQGKQVLYLLPEIALTTQIISRLRKYFGDKIGVYHSKFNENERVEVWQAVSHQHATTRFPIILGARSAIFLPYSNLGLIIVDEEHETSFKQYQPAPRYHARDTAIMLAKIHKAKVLLGTATPSVETYWNAQNNKYGLVELNKRYRDIQLPEIVVADIKEAIRTRKMKSHFSPLLFEEMERALANKEQIILFRNRRGFAPILHCQMCDWIPQCTHCDVSLTYHKHINRLKCHYCGHTIQPPTTCNACGSEKMELKGFGTEKIEEELAIFFPEAKIARMDWDTTRQKNAYQNIINGFEDRLIDVLIGTQMVTKGLDFDNVSLVGILNADTMLHFPDFRSFERSYQMMAQVAGRAGRKNKRGKVVIQTYNPNHAIIQQVLDNNYTEMYKHEILERKNFNYPPFYRLIQLTLKHVNIDLLNKGAQKLTDDLSQYFGKRILGPEFPTIARVRNQFQKNILIKLEQKVALIKAKEVLSQQILQFKTEKKFASIQIIIDVDPM